MTLFSMNITGVMGSAAVGLQGLHLGCFGVLESGLTQKLHPPLCLDLLVMTPDQPCPWNLGFSMCLPMDKAKRNIPHPQSDGQESCL